jgi:hypothetical protein
MPSIRSAVEAAAADFVEAIMAIFNDVSLDDLAAERSGGARPRKTSGITPSMAKALKATSIGRPKKKGARLARRSPEQIAEIVGRVVGLLKKNKDGLRSEQIRAELAMAAKEMPRVLQEGLDSKKMRKRGEKRATVYFAK